MKIIHLALLTSTCLGAASVAPEGSSAEDNFAAALEYRRARESDHVRREHGFEDAAVFEAAKPQSEDPDEIVADATFGLLSTPRHGEWVYIPRVFVREKYRKRGVATEMMRRLLEYVQLSGCLYLLVLSHYAGDGRRQVHWKNPRVVAGWLRVSSDNRGAIKAYKKAGFIDEGAVVPEELRGFEGIFHFIHNFVYTFNASTPSFVSSNNDDDDSLPYLKRSVMIPFFSELIEEGIADEVYSNSSSPLLGKE
ncbi:hypothetical protein FOZ63_000155 [Perkinsus olseni]|uniref:N-acetyltransferase domain-containing protein n=1 Tax=Perkinsus olseni TaxID=32597 RepID=A0A7J6RKC2_PEROL|nr:hypothetical protein FOZ63_000155 [Perkinsus olseni]KAF4720937.1 hypothetical protein FOZ62_008418 [Perkinsus olseni]